MNKSKVEAFRTDAHKIIAAKEDPRVTIYFKGALGFGKVEGRLLSIIKGGVQYTPRQGSKPRMLGNYYYPFWMVVEGWNLPDPSAVGYETPQAVPGGATRKSKYRSTDPKWIEDFMKEIGNKLKAKAIATQRSGNVKILKKNLVPSTEPVK